MIQAVCYRTVTQRSAERSEQEQGFTRYSTTQLEKGFPEGDSVTADTDLPSNLVRAGGGVGSREGAGGRGAGSEHKV